MMITGTIHVFVIMGESTVDNAPKFEPDMHTKHIYASSTNNK